MIKKTLSRGGGAVIPPCFRPVSAAADDPNPSGDPPTAATTTNLTTCLYHTRLGIFALTWSRSILGRSLDLHLLPHNHSFRLNLHPLLFWKKQGFQNLHLPSSSSSSSPATIFWDLTRAKFGSGSGPEPESGFYIAVLFGGELVLKVGDLSSDAYAKLKANRPDAHQQALVVRREHVHGTKLHRTKTVVGGKLRRVSIECNDSDPDPKLLIWFDDKKVLQVKHLKWKFRGSERIEVDGQPIQLSWDVYNWLFDGGEKGEGFALFTFRFEMGRGGDSGGEVGGERVFLSEEVPAERGWRKKKGLVMKARSSSSSSLSSASSSACGSVLEWESVEETELKGPTGFSLLVYAWKS